MPIVEPENADRPATPKTQFHWQVIPGTLLLIFGVASLAGGPAVVSMIWRRHERGFEVYAGDDIPYWCAYILLALAIQALVFFVGSLQWFRYRSRAALTMTAAGFAIYAASFWWIMWRFPDL